MTIAVARFGHKQAPDENHAPIYSQTHLSQTPTAHNALTSSSTGVHELPTAALASVQQQVEVALSSMQASLSSVTGVLAGVSQEGQALRQELVTLQEGWASKQEVSELKAAVEALTAVLMRQGGIQRLDSLISGAREQTSTAAAAAVAEVDTAVMPPRQEPASGQSGALLPHSYHLH
jgi:hypothetical protein